MTMRMLRFFNLFVFLGSLNALASGATWEPGETKCLPNFRNDKPVGYLCLKVEPGSIYQKTGLRNGDNVIEINHQSVTEALGGAGGTDKVIELWREFEKNNTAILLVERGDKKLVLKKPTSESSH